MSWIEDVVPGVSIPRLPIPGAGDVTCLPWIGHPYYLQTVWALKAAKKKGVINTLSECQAAANDASRLAGIIGGDLANLVAHSLAKCACKEVFIGGSAGATPPSSVVAWRQVSGSARDIGIGANGGVWAIGTDARPPDGFGVWRWGGAQSWSPVAGAGKRIAVDPHGNPWVLNDKNDIWRWTGTGFTQVQGKACDIGIGADGSIWVLGHNLTTGGFGIWHWDGGNNFSSRPGGGVRITVNHKGEPWVVNDHDDIFRWVGDGFVQVEGKAKDIAAGADGTVWVIGNNTTNGGFGIWHWDGGHNFSTVDGGGTQIAVDPHGHPWVINSAGEIWALG